MFSYNPRCKMLIPPFSHDGVMHYGNFVPRLYNLCRSLDFTPGKIMPARAFCSDENQGYPLIQLTKHFGTFLFNHGRAGGIMATDRHKPHAHHGKDLLILQASHVGYDPETGQFGTYRRIRTEHKECPPTCGKINSIIRPYQEEYRFATENILLRKRGDDFLMTIDNQLLKISREEGLFLNMDNFIATHGDNTWQRVEVHSTAKTYRLLETAVERLGAELFPSEGAAAIGTNLPADWFYYKRDLESIRQDKRHLDHNLFTVMPHIVTAPSPLLAAAQVNTMAEFDSAFRTIVKTNAYQAQKVLLVSGINIDISPNHDEVFPLTKFAPWAAYYKDEHGVGQVWEQAELVERLLAQPLDNPEQIDLEEAIATMSRTPDIDIIWPG